MDRLQQMRIFIAVAEEEGFAAAARRLQLSPPAVTRAVAALEQHLGVQLLQRTTRLVRPTEAGRRYLEDARGILAAVDAADDAAAGINADPRGRLVVTAPVLFGRLHVMPGIVDYLQCYPGMSVDALFLDRPVNLLEEGIDVGVRIGELPDSSMRALRVGAVRRVLVASATYLSGNGEPSEPGQLVDHTLISSNAGNFGAAWRFQHKGVEQTLRVRPRLSVTSNDAALEAAVAGLGITRLLSYQAAQALASGKVVPLLVEFETAPYPVHIIHRESSRSPTRVRTFIDMLAERLRNNSALRH